MRRLIIILDHSSLLGLEIDHTSTQISMLSDVVGNLLRMRLGGILARRWRGQVGMGQYRHDGCAISCERGGFLAQGVIDEVLKLNVTTMHGQPSPDRWLTLMPSVVHQAAVLGGECATLLRAHAARLCVYDTY